MKRKLLALVFVLAFAITPFFAFGAHSAAAVDLTTPGTCVEIPANATGGAVTAITNVLNAGAEPPLTFDFTDSTC